MTVPAEPDAATRLCTACGLCCNGVLFQIVRLQPEDSVKQLEALGMKFSRKKTAPYFNQPCRFLHDCRCAIYEARPSRCRKFECRQLQRMAAGEVTEAEAGHSIAAVQRMAAEIEALLQKMGNTSVHLPLADRHAEVLADAGPGTDKRGLATLARKMEALAVVLDRDFRLPPGGK